MTWQEALVQATERAAEAYEYQVWYRTVVGTPLTIFAVVLAAVCIVGGVMLLAEKCMADD